MFDISQIGITGFYINLSPCQKKNSFCASLSHCFWKMTIQLYKWSSRDQIDQFKKYLAQNGPTTSTMLGLLLQTGLYPSVDPIEPVYWTSHPDPFNTSEVVVWIVDRGECTLRTLVSSKIYLDKAPMDLERLSKARTGVYDSDKPLFVNPEDEALYQHSLQVFESVMDYFFTQNYTVNDGNMD